MPAKPKTTKKTPRLDETPSEPVLVGEVIKAKKATLATKPKAVMGRPSGYSEELANEICARVMERPLSKVCLDEDMPSRDTVHRWLANNEDFSDNYVRACRVRREYRFETLEDIATQEEDVARARLRVDVIKWQLSKEEPKKYGDKLDIESKTQVKHSFGELTDEQLDKLIAERQNSAA